MYMYQSLKMDPKVFKCQGIIPASKKYEYKEHFTTGKHEGQEVIFTKGYKGDKIIR